MTRCQTCFNHERFCTCNGPLTDRSTTADDYWTAVVKHNAREAQPLLPIDTRWQRMAMAAFN